MTLAVPNQESTQSRRCVIPSRNHSSLYVRPRLRARAHAPGTRLRCGRAPRHNLSKIHTAAQRLHCLQGPGTGHLSFSKGVLRVPGRCGWLIRAGQLGQVAAMM
eukprot:750180-Hanusia_phi.AAC.11